MFIINSSSSKTPMFVASKGSHKILAKQSPPYVSMLKDKFLQATTVQFMQLSCYFLVHPKTLQLMLYCTFPFFVQPSTKSGVLNFDSNKILCTFLS